MMDARTVATAALGIALLTPVLHGQGAAQYRNFALRSHVADVATVAGVTPLEAKTIHQRPALLQDLEWRPSRWMVGSVTPSTDPVAQIVFSFYNDQLFRIVVDYAPERTAGMTNADMIEAISSVYGESTKRPPGAARVASGPESERGSVLARWGDAAYAVVLYQGWSYGEGYRLILTEPALNTLAAKASVQAVRLDAQDAPRQEAARQKQEREDTRVAADKARIVNKKVFRP